MKKAGSKKAAKGHKAAGAARGKPASKATARKAAASRPSKAPAKSSKKPPAKPVAKAGKGKKDAPRPVPKAPKPSAAKPKPKIKPKIKPARPNAGSRPGAVTGQAVVNAAKAAAAHAGAVPSVRASLTPMRAFEKADVERAARLILKAVRPTAPEDDEDQETQRNKLFLEVAHPRRRPDGNYEVFLRYQAGPGLTDPEAEAETLARSFFERTGEFAGIAVAVDIKVPEDRES